MIKLVLIFLYGLLNFILVLGLMIYTQVDLDRPVGTQLPKLLVIIIIIGLANVCTQSIIWKKSC